SMTRASRLYFLAHATHWAEGLIVVKSMMHPSDFETILCLTTRMSPASNTIRCRFNACSNSSASESPALISLARTIGIRRSSAGSGFEVRFLPRTAAGLRAGRRARLTDPLYRWPENCSRAPTVEAVFACGFRRDEREVGASPLDCRHRPRCLAVATRYRVCRWLCPRRGGA